MSASLTRDHGDAILAERHSTDCDAQVLLSCTVDWLFAQRNWSHVDHFQWRVVDTCQSAVSRSLILSVCSCAAASLTDPQPRVGHGSGPSTGRFGSGRVGSDRVQIFP